MNAGGFFKTIRILLLLFILILVAGDYLLTKFRTTDWDMPLQMVIYPINGDGSETSAEYIRSLDKSTFEPIEAFMKEEAAQYELNLTQPLDIVLGPAVEELPPKPPQERKVFNIMWWSLKMRYWAHRFDNYDGPTSDIRMYVVYYDPATHDRLEHSLGLEKGLIGVVNAFAAKKLEKKNNVVVAHEMLHTVGATDKYDLSSGEPQFPDGFAEPDKTPLYPQNYAEIMAGVIPDSKTSWDMPPGLTKTIIGPKTATEINWIKAK